MTEESMAPNWKYPAILSVLLVVVVVSQKPVLAGLSAETTLKFQPLWNMLKVVLAFAVYLSWNKQIKLAPFFATPRGENYRSALPAFITCVLLVLSAGAAFLLLRPSAEMEGTVYDYDWVWFIYSFKIAAVFVYLTVLLLGRRILMALVRIISGQKDKLPQRLASGFADGILIIAHPVLIIVWELFFHKIPSAEPQTWLYIRYMILGAVITGIRVGWGFVPEDRLEIIREFIVFLRERKLWWMTPIFIVLGLLVALVLLTESTGGSFPFIYAIF